MNKKSGEVTYLTPKAVRMLFESRPSLRTIQRWMTRGVHNRLVSHGRGMRITLDHIRDGDTLLTTTQWVAEFQLACLLNRKTALNHKPEPGDDA